MNEWKVCWTIDQYGFHFPRHSPEAGFELAPRDRPLRMRKSWQSNPLCYSARYDFATLIFHLNFTTQIFLLKISCLNICCSISTTFDSPFRLMFRPGWGLLLMVSSYYDFIVITYSCKEVYPQCTSLAGGITLWQN